MATCGGPPRLQRRALELHDSKLLRWEARGTGVSLRLDGYVHASLGVPGEDRGTGWSQELELVLGSAKILEEPRELPLWISGGAVEIAGQRLSLLPVPFDDAANVLLRFEGAEGALAVSGSGLAIREVSEARFIERVEK